jgi:MFS family permease
MDTDPHPRRGSYAPRATYAPIATLLAGYAVLITGNGLLGTLVSLRLVPPEFSSATAGLVQSAYYLGFVFGALLSSHFILTLGHRPAFAVFAVVVACASLVHPMTDTAAAWWVLRFVAGFCLAGVFSVVESLLHAHADNAVRGRVFSFYMMSTYLGVAGGQLLLNLGSPAGSVLFGAVAALFIASLLPIVMAAARLSTQARPELRVPAEKKALLHALVVSPVGTAGCVLAGVLNSCFYTLLPAYLSQVGFSIADLSFMMFSALLTALVCQWPAGFLSDHFDRRRVLAGASLGILALCIVLAGQPKGSVLRLQVGLFAGVAFTVYPLSVALINDRVTSSLRVPASAAVLVAFSLGGTLGPVLASATVGRVGPQGLFGFCAAATGLFMLICLRSLLLSPTLASSRTP